MASASSQRCDGQLLCSICLDVFTEPVTTPCGHNYCKTCITDYWARSDRAQCPLCLKKFRRKPQLQVNTGFRDMLEQFNNMKMKDEDNNPAKPGEVPCDICLVPKQLKAQKTCLVCLTSYCQPHLEPHQRVAALKKHQLIDPVSNLEDRMCKKHDKVFELFCREDQTCVCLMCVKDNHATHEIVSLEQALLDWKDQLDYVTAKTKMMENTKSRSLDEVKFFVEQNKKRSAKEMADVAKVFTTLLEFLQRSQAKLIAVIQERQKVALKRAADHMTQLEKEVDELRRRSSEIDQLAQTKDHVRLLQSWTSLSHIDLFDPLTSTLTPDLYDISQQSCVGVVKKAVAQMEMTLSNEMEELIVRLSDGCEWPVGAERPMTDEFVHEVWTPPLDKLMMIQQCNAVEVTLDANTAYPFLLVSEDGKQLRLGQIPTHWLNSHGRKFDSEPFVIGREGFSSGRFYYEVRVSGCKAWVLGVVKGSINKETFSFNTFKEGCWTFCGICHFYDEYFANSHSNPISYVGQRPQTVGVFVDYEKGEVSFYDVDARTLIYSYSGCTFTEETPALKAFLYSMAGASLSNRAKLHPIFGIIECHHDNMLEITPVAHTA